MKKIVVLSGSELNKLQEVSNDIALFAEFAQRSTGSRIAEFTGDAGVDLSEEEFATLAIALRLTALAAHEGLTVMLKLWEDHMKENQEVNDGTI